MRIAVVAGKFDLLHSGHIDHITKASKYGEYLLIVTHLDSIVAKTSGKGFCAVPLCYRMILLNGILLHFNISGRVVVGKDEDGSVIQTLGYIRSIYPNDTINYCKGGDRVPSNMNQDEVEACQRLGIELVYGVGDLLGSSSKFVDRIKNKIEL
jgi:cytidyltransferase-like protein